LEQLCGFCRSLRTPNVEVIRDPAEPATLDPAEDFIRDLAVGCIQDRAEGSIPDLAAAYIQGLVVACIQAPAEDFIRGQGWLVFWARRRNLRGTPRWRGSLQRSMEPLHHRG
jgi:hypothetical protein